MSETRQLILFLMLWFVVLMVSGISIDLRDLHIRLGKIATVVETNDR